MIRDLDARKADMRRRMREARRALHDRDLRAAAISGHVAALCDRIARERARPLVVMAFVGVGAEPDTTEVVAVLTSRGHDVVLPRIRSGALQPARRGEALAIGEFNIPSPTGESVGASLLDVVLVPGLAFTRDGRRLGQGGGFYDRFLDTVGASCVAAGVCFSAQLVEDVPCDAHDRHVDVVITEDEVVEASAGLAPAGQSSS
jgi:5-formyltetrahydrofolate cyclo-ligase